MPLDKHRILWRLALRRYTQTNEFRLSRLSRRSGYLLDLCNYSIPEPAVAVVDVVENLAIPRGTLRCPGKIS